MNKEKWNGMTDEQKTKFMRNVFKQLNFGDEFDYAESRKHYERMKEAGLGSHGAYANPCITLELVDPIMATEILSWMYSHFDDEGNNTVSSGETPPIFGYNMTELTFDKSTLMDYNDSEKEVLREAIRIINKHAKAFKEE